MRDVPAQEPSAGVCLCVCMPGRLGSFARAESFWKQVLPATAGAPEMWRIVDGTAGDVHALTERAEICIVSADEIDGSVLELLRRIGSLNPAAGVIVVLHEIHHISRFQALEAGADAVLPLMADGRLVNAAITALRRRLSPPALNPEP
ncbi:MAG TPA: hypothetical protein VD995_03780 [Azospirillum sp.]|nr:hypothetical protein [Azospirillum sp.]